MIKINQTGPKLNEKAASKTKGKKSQKTGKLDFSHELENTISHEFSGSIDTLMNDLKDQEKRFLDQQSLYELEKYKALVQKILKNILDEGFQTGTLKRRRRDRADFTVIKNINDKLFALSQAITKGNKAFNFFKTIEEIRGLVFDLVY